MRKLQTLLAIAALSATMAFAQFRPMHGQDNGTTDPATMIANRVAFLKALLTLTDAQATQASTILTNELAAETPIRTNLTTLETSLQAAVKSNSTAQIDSLSAQIGTAHGQLTAIDAKADAAFYALLTADQKTKYDALGGHDGPGGGPGGGRGGR